MNCLDNTIYIRSGAIEHTLLCLSTNGKNKYSTEINSFV